MRMKGKEMNVFLYIIIFIMGTLFGSFYTLAVYRIPKKIDITHTHSFCPNCNHKLGFIELIPVLSYIFLGGKCKECKQKIRPRYLILEILSGVTFVIIAYLFRIDAYNINVYTLIDFAFIVLYLAALFIIAGIDKENIKIEKSVLYYALLVCVAYIIYLCIMDHTSIYRYAMYLIAVIILLFIDGKKLKNEAKDSYAISILNLILIMAMMTGELATIGAMIFTFIIILELYIINRIKFLSNKSRKEEKKVLKSFPWGFYLCLGNIISMISIMAFI